MRATFITLFTLMFFTSAYSEKLPIAVNTFEPQGVEKSAAGIITNRLRNELFKTGVFTVLERGKMEDILKEQGFQQTGCTSDACIVEAGQLLGVKYMVAGSIGKLGVTYTISARFIDVATGKIVLTADTDIDGKLKRVLTEATAQIAEKFSAGVRGGSKKKEEQIKPPKKCGINIESVPSGAVLYLNGKQKGNTPYNSSIDAGNYELLLKKSSYKDILDDIHCSAGGTFKEKYDLEHIKEYEDSVERYETAWEAVKETRSNKEKKKGIGLKVSLGIGTAGALVAGYLFNKIASDDVHAAENARSDYESGSINFSDASVIYNNKMKSAERNVILRNALYGTSSLCAGLFVLTFIF